MLPLRFRLATSACALVCYAATATAQSYVFQDNQGASNFSWTGSVTIPFYSPNPLPIVGNPSSTFQLQGSVNMDFPTGMNPISSALYSGGDSLMIPDFHGLVNNPINPNLPPIAYLDITGAHIAFQSNQSFPVAPNGSFSMVSPEGFALVALAGTVSYTIQGFSPGGGPLAPNTTNYVQSNGTITRSSNVLHVNMPVSGLSFPFVYTITPSGGGPPIQVIGQITMNGVLDGTDTIPLAGTPFCLGDGTGGSCPCGNSGATGHGCDNSHTTGGALLTAYGVASLSNDSLQLESTSETPTPLSIFLQGTANVSPLNFGDGLRCTGGTLKRLRTEAAVGGTVLYPDGGDLPVHTSSANHDDPIPVGGTRYYQVYYRDPNATFCASPPGGTFNVSGGIMITWGA